MALRLTAGHFYEFHRRRVYSRPGQPIQVYECEGVEIGPEIAEPEARLQVRRGRDVYTPRESDAERLAMQTHPIRPVRHPRRGERLNNPAYFAHFHPGGVHPEAIDEWEGRPKYSTIGHIFFGGRGGM